MMEARTNSGDVIESFPRSNEISLELHKENLSSVHTPTLEKNELIPLFLLMTFSLFSLIGCGTKTEVVNQQVVPATGPPERNKKVPVEVSYPVINEWDDAQRHGIEIRLNMKVSPAVLREIALEIKSHESRQHLRTFISYRLPQFDPSARDLVWATSHFNPTLEVQLNGSDLVDEQKARDQQLDFRGKILGPWFRESFCSIDYIFEDLGKFKLAECFHDGNRSDSNLVEIPSTIGRRFELKSGNEQYEVDSYGDLRVYGFEGNMIEATPLIKK